MGREPQLQFHSMTAGPVDPPPRKSKIVKPPVVTTLGFPNSPHMHALQAKRDQERFDRACEQYSKDGKREMSLIRGRLLREGMDPHQVAALCDEPKKE